MRPGNGVTKGSGQWYVSSSPNVSFAPPTEKMPRTRALVTATAAEAKHIRWSVSSTFVMAALKIFMVQECPSFFLRLDLDALFLSDPEQ